MSYTVSVLTTGSEILDGRVLDTNSNFVAQALADHGLKLVHVLAVDDDLDQMIDGLTYLAKRSALVITSGGLGPTDDDMTRTAVAKFLDVGLSERPEARAHLESFYAARKRKFDPSNLKQALLPDGTSMIPNQSGTAPGFFGMSSSGSAVCSLSGVPREFREMFQSSVLPRILEASGTQVKIARRAFRIFGVPESNVGRYVHELGLPAAITVSYRAAFPEVHVVLKSAGDSVELDRAADAVRRSIPEGAIFTEAPESDLARTVHELLLKDKKTVACAESCTGGLMGSLLTQYGGASAFFEGGVVSYSNRIKEELLGVEREGLVSDGAVSSWTAERMAARIKSLVGADIGISITGIAGPDGGTAEKPVGTFYVGISTSEITRSIHCLFVGERRNIRVYAAHVGLDLIRRTLEHRHFPATFPIPFESDSPGRPS